MGFPGFQVICRDSELRHHHQPASRRPPSDNTLSSSTTHHCTPPPLLPSLSSPRAIAARHRTAIPPPAFSPLAPRNTAPGSCGARRTHTEPAAVCDPRPRAQQHYLNPLTLTFYYIIPHRAYTSILPFSPPPPRYTHIPLPLASLYPPSPPATRPRNQTRSNHAPPPRRDPPAHIRVSRDHSFC